MLGIDSKFCLIFNSGIPSYKSALEALEAVLSKKGVNYVKHDIQDMTDCTCSDYDFVFVIGGDGTILRTAKVFAPFEIPVFGLNIGRLGFLSQLNQSEIEPAVDKILNNEFKVEKRLMLKTQDMLALNDFVIKGVTASRTGRFRLKINDKFVCEYIADGMIISTPTGSTAYGLSAGGPVLYPMIDALVVVPICPHTLTARPLVIPSTEKISIFSIDNNYSFNLAVDGDDAGVFSPVINIESSELKAHLALLDDDFYNVLRSKFHWGVAPEK